MRQKWESIQYVEISIHEIFCFQDKLDAAGNDPEKLWDIIDDFFSQAENELELNPNFIRDLKDADIDTDFIEIEDIDDVFEEPHERTAQDYVNYVLAQAKKKRYDIPFTPRHDF